MFPHPERELRLQSLTGTKQAARQIIMEEAELYIHPVKTAIKFKTSFNILIPVHLSLFKFI
jgi:hypothetical protein